MVYKTWIAIIIVLLTTLFSKYIFHISIQFSNILITLFILFLLNGIYYYVLKTHLWPRRSNLYQQTHVFINVQISTDLIVLTLLLHFSGGVQNPFIIIYIFHMMLSGIMLSLKESFFQTSFALLLVGTIAALEYLGVVHHHKLEGFIEHDMYRNLKYLILTGTVFVLVSYTTVYMTHYVTSQLRKFEEANRKANRILEKKDKIKNEYVLKLTHDIKSYVTVINHCLRAVHDTDYEHSEENTDLIGRAFQRARKLSHFIRDLIKLTRVQLDSDMEKKEFNTEELLRDILSSVENIASEKSIKISTEIDKRAHKIFGNPISIKELISNLLLNAITYSYTKGTVRLSIKKPRNKIIIEISDEGIGIPDEETKKIFRAFYRASNAKDYSKEGTGMGLAIVNEIVKSHKGKIKCESNTNEGTTFRVILPLV